MNALDLFEELLICRRVTDALRAIPDESGPAFEEAIENLITALPRESNILRTLPVFSPEDYVLIDLADNARMMRQVLALPQGEADPVTDDIGKTEVFQSGMIKILTLLDNATKPSKTERAALYLAAEVTGYHGPDAAPPTRVSQLVALSQWAFHHLEYSYKHGGPQAGADSGYGSAGMEMMEIANRELEERGMLVLIDYPPEWEEIIRAAGFTRLLRPEWD